MRQGLVLALILCAGGCAARGPVRLPTGEWSGKGILVYENWASARPGTSIHREYKTRMSVQRAMPEKEGAFEIEIVSERGELPEGLGPKTHLLIRLEEVKRPSDSIVQYRVAALFNPKPGEQPAFEEDSPPIGATCTRVNDTTFLQIVYDEGFVDEIRFRGRGLTKAGSFKEEHGLIQWAEALTQTRPVDRLR